MSHRIRHTEAALTEEQLRLGLRQLWRPGWPDDLAAVLAHPVRGPAVRGMARQLSRQTATPGRTPVAYARSMPPVTPTPTHPPVRHVAGRLARNTFDAKRAAANDFDDN